MYEVRVERVVTCGGSNGDDGRRAVVVRRVGNDAGEELMLTLPRGDGELVEAALAGAPSDPLPRVLAFAGVDLVAVEIVALAPDAWGARLRLRSGRGDGDVASSAAHGLAAALACRCPLRIGSDAWAAHAVDPSDLAADRARADRERRRLERRLAGRRTPRTGGAAAVAVALTDPARTAIAEALEAARTALDARHALLIHRAGGLVVGRGDGPAEVLDAYAAAVAAGDADLAELLRLELFPTDEHEPSGIVFDDVERDWRVEIGPVTADHLPDPSLRALHDRLVDVLAGP